MSKDMKNMLVPMLRFPEFRSAGEWKEHQLGQCLSRHPEYGINAPAVPYAENLPTYLRITDISEDGQIRQTQKVSVAMGVTDENYLDEGDIVLARTGASVGKAYKYRTTDGKLVFAGFLIRVKPDAKKLNSEFLFQFLSTEQYWYWVNLNSARSGQPGINGNEYSLLPIPLPSTLKEQQKIADFLTSIDALISMQSQKVMALKAHKKGLMQQLFPQDGETVPHLRFPEFGEAGEWEEKALDKICSSISSGKDKGNSNGKYDLYGSTGVIGKTSNDTYDGSFILAARVGANAGLLTKATGKFGVTDNTLVIILKISENIDFIFYSLEKFGLNKMVFGSGQPLITGGQLKEVGISLPSPEEQKKVADCLTSIDELLHADIKKLAALKTHKKGLMQQLFPATDHGEGA